MIRPSRPELFVVRAAVATAIASIEDRETAIETARADAFERDQPFPAYPETGDRIMLEAVAVIVDQRLGIPEQDALTAVAYLQAAIERLTNSARP